MTFDEAWKQILESAIPIQIPDEAGDAEILQSELTDIFEELRQEYAPTVEMSQEQKEVIIEYMNDDAFDFTDFMENEAGATFLFMDMEEKDLMQAWQHPETIKVVDE